MTTVRSNPLGIGAFAAMVFFGCNDPDSFEEAEELAEVEDVEEAGDIETFGDIENVGSPDGAYAYTVNCDQQGANCCTGYPLYSVCFYMSTAGDNANDGLTEEDAVATLEGAQDAIGRYIDANGPIATHIEVRIDQGVYVQTEAVDWRYYTPGYYTYFIPSDYKWGAWGSFEGRPIFWGLGTGDPWFRLDGWSTGLNGPGEFTRMAFYYLEVRNYGTAAIVFDGPTNSQAKWNGYNFVYGMYFGYLGTKWTNGDIGYAGLFLVNSRNNTIRNNHFVFLENDTSGESGVADIHAVYMKNWSSDNRIESNRMHYISGDPIRVRHDSNRNSIRSNVMYRTGAAGQYSDFYQDHLQGAVDCNANYSHTNQECPSWRNEFRYNTVQCGYDGDYIPHYYFFGTGTQTQNRYCVPSGCPDYDPFNVNNLPRVSTASNTEHCP